MDMSRLIARRRPWAIAGRNGGNMGRTTDTHTGLLVVRIWREQLSEDPLRIHARITSTVDVVAADDRMLVVDSTDQVTQAVREWLRRYLVHYPRQL
jgi:LPS sulfotransferase NodH